MKATTRSLATTCVATIVAVTAYFGTVPLTGVVVVLVAATAVGWSALLHLHARAASGIVVGLVGLGSVATVAATGGEPVLRHLPVVVAMGILLAFVNELARHDPREAVVENVAGVVCGVVVAVSCAGWIAAGRSDEGAALVVSGAVALAVAGVVCSTPLRGWAGAVTAVVLAVVAGGAVADVLPDVTMAAGVWAGLVGGLLVAAVDAIIGHLPAGRGWWASLAAAVLPVAVGGILVFVVGQLVQG
jgi:hypothetical protein